MADWGTRLWVTGTSLLIGFIAYSSQIFVIWPWYGRVLSVDLIKLLVPFNLFVAMIWWNYRLVVTTSPGHVPEGWRPDLHSGDAIEVKGSGGLRYCKMCDHYKPPRAHHCRKCKTCVLKLDHHCPWVANCVGYFNHGHFIRFLLWVDIACSYHLVMMCFKGYEMFLNPFDIPDLSDMLFLVFNFAACIPVWICVGFFSLYHLYLISGNSTTIERWEKDKVATLVRRGKIKEIKYPYNVGYMNNMKAVLGPNPWLWLWPQTMRDDGLSYPVNPDAGEREMQYSWPPRDPTQYMPSAPMADSPWTYGGGFNPDLVPSSGALRARHAAQRSYVPPWETELNSDGEERNGSMSPSSSPEPYLSDYDDEMVAAGCMGVSAPGMSVQGNGTGAGAGDGAAATAAYTTATRVRRGSEGWEVRPVPGWASTLEDERRYVQRPWERPGRYNVYDPNDQHDE